MTLKRAAVLALIGVALRVVHPGLFHLALEIYSAGAAAHAPSAVVALLPDLTLLVFLAFFRAELGGRAVLPARRRAAAAAAIVILIGTAFEARTMYRLAAVDPGAWRLALSVLGVGGDVLWAVLLKGFAGKEPWRDPMLRPLALILAAETVVAAVWQDYSAARYQIRFWGAGTYALMETTHAFGWSTMALFLGTLWARLQPAAESPR